MSVDRIIDRPSQLQPEAAGISIEAGHLYLRDLQRSDAALADMFGRVALWVDCAKGECSTASTAFMFDDYNMRPDPEYMPEKVIERVLKAAAEGGVKIDYIAREAACVPLAEQVKQRFVDRDPRLSHRTVAIRTRDLSGDPGPRTITEPWSPKRSQMFMYAPAYHVTRRKKRQWSCPALATMWQLSRLASVPEISLGEPQSLDLGQLCGVEWSELPPLMQVNSNAKPFIAERVTSILPNTFIGVECGVKEIIRDVFEETPGEITELINHAFVSL